MIAVIGWHRTYATASNTNWLDDTTSTADTWVNGSSGNTMLDPGIFRRKPDEPPLRRDWRLAPWAGPIMAAPLLPADYLPAFLFCKRRPSRNAPHWWAGARERRKKAICL